MPIKNYKSMNEAIFHFIELRRLYQQKAKILKSHGFGHEHLLRNLGNEITELGIMLERNGMSIDNLLFMYNVKDGSDS